MNTASNQADVNYRAFCQMIAEQARRDTVALTPRQQWVWYLERRCRRLGVLNHWALHRFDCPLNKSAAQAAVDAIVARHDALRTTFHSVGDVPLRLVQDYAHCHLRTTRVAEGKVATVVERERLRPFDVSSAPLMQVTLISVGGACSLLLIKIHQLIADASTADLVALEFQSEYWHIDPPTEPGKHGLDATESILPSRLASQPCNLPLSTTAMPDLPFVAPRRGVQSLSSAIVHDRWQMKDLIPDQRLVDADLLRSTLLAALFLVLRVYYAQDDLALVTDATPVHGSSGTAFEELSRRVVIRTTVHGEESVSQVITKTQVALDRAVVDNELFESIALRVAGRDGFRRAPVAQVMVAIRPENDNPAFQSSCVDYGFIADGFDIAIVARPGSSQIDFVVTYDSEACEFSAIPRMLEHWRNVVRSIFHDHDRKVDELDLIGIVERETLLVDWGSGPSVPVPDKRLHQLIEEQTDLSPLAIAVRDRDRTLSYQALESTANQLARYLQSIGVTTGEVVALAMEGSTEFLIAAFAVMKLGAAYLPLDLNSPADRLALVLSDSRSKFVITRDRDHHLSHHHIAVDGKDIAVVDLTLAKEAIRSHPTDRLSYTDGDLAYVIYTSGSTGTPKGVEVRHAGVVNYLSWALSNFDVQSREGAPVHTSVAFDLAVTAMFAPLLAGRTVSFLPVGLGVAPLADSMRRHNYSFVTPTPSHLSALLRSKRSATSFGAETVLVVGGEPLSSETARPWLSSGGRFFNAYGPTEASVVCCAWEVPADVKTTDGRIPIGRPIWNTRLYVLDPRRRLVPIGVHGELYIAGRGLARGYLGDAAKTTERFVPDPFGEPGSLMYRTGDLVRYRSDGLLVFLGRIDDQVKVRGHRIELGEVEVALEAFPGVAAAAASVQRAHSGEPYLVAHVLITDADTTSDDIRQYLRRILPIYMVPTELVMVSDIALTANGKIDRPALIRHETANSTPDSKNEGLKTLQDCFSWALGFEPLPDADFFDSGGTLPSGAAMLLRASVLLDRTLTLQDLCAAPSVRGLAQVATSAVTDI